MDPCMLTDKESPSKSSTYSQPRKITLRKDEYGFGFTLRHFIVYPPASLGNVDSLLADPKDQSPTQSNELKFDEHRRPMDTIFIREVKERSPAHREGLVKGDRIIAINDHPLIGKTYSDIIQLILESGTILQLLVVPKEDDILQLYFASSAYEPVNRQCKADCAEDNICHQSRKYLVKNSPQRSDPRKENSSAVDDRSSGKLEYKTKKLFDTSIDPDASLTESDDSLNCIFQNGNKILSVPGQKANNWDSYAMSNKYDNEQRNRDISSGSVEMPSFERTIDELTNANCCNRLNSTKNDKSEQLINLVAQRCHHIESGTMLAESLEKVKMFRSELSSMSNTSQIHIVSDHAAHFEKLSSKNKVMSSSYPNPSCNGNTLGENNRTTDLSLNNVNCIENSLQKDNTSAVISPIKECTSYPLDVSASEPSIPNNSVKADLDNVKYRKKSEPTVDEECHLTRRISYLRATAEHQICLDSESNTFRSNRNGLEKSATDNKITAETNEDSDGDYIPDISNTVYGWLICKLVLYEGKRASDRSWRHVWAVLRDDTLYFLKERKEPSDKSVSTDEHIFSVSQSSSEIASDYLKRKNVLRLRLNNGTEYLMQAESQATMQRWLSALQCFQTVVHKFVSQICDSNVIEKATAYEQRLVGSKTSAIANHLRYPMKKLVLWYRSPTDQARRSYHGDELSLPKSSHLWCDRVVHGFKKVHGSLTQDSSKFASIGVPIENAPTGSHKHIPLLVELCVHVIESRGLEMVGVYRIPGNSASVSILTDVVNQGLDYLALQDPRWNDVNVISSLLKAYFRKLPDPLLTSSLYSKFIAASRTEDSKKRLAAIKNVILSLPIHHYNTLKFLMHHLKNVVDHSHVNKMEARNLAIVFGPTLVRRADNNMAAMVTDMSHQCQLVETMINYDTWLFDSVDTDQPFDLQSENAYQQLSTCETSKLDENFFALSMAQKEENVKSDTQVISQQQLRAKPRNKRNTQKSKRGGIIEQDDKDSSEEIQSLRDPECMFDRVSKSEILKSPSKNASNLFGITSDPLVSLDSKEESLTYDAPYYVVPLQKTLDRKSDERSLHTYKELSNHAQEKAKQFEMETKSLLTRQANKPVNFTKTGHFEWDTIEKEWEKAKLELEEDDFLDHLADDPLFLKFLFNQETHASSQEPCLVNEPKDSKRSFDMFNPFYKGECLKPAYYLPVTSGIRKSASTSTFETGKRSVMPFATDLQFDMKSIIPREKDVDCNALHFHTLASAKISQSEANHRRRREFCETLPVFSPVPSTSKSDNHPYEIGGSQEIMTSCPSPKLDSITTALPKRYSPADSSS